MSDETEINEYEASFLREREKYYLEHPEELMSEQSKVDLDNQAKVNAAKVLASKVPFGSEIQETVREASSTTEEIPLTIPRWLAVALNRSLRKNVRDQRRDRLGKGIPVNPAHGILRTKASESLEDILNRVSSKRGQKLFKRWAKDDFDKYSRHRVIFRVPDWREGLTSTNFKMLNSWIKKTASTKKKKKSKKSKKVDRSWTKLHTFTDRLSVMLTGVGRFSVFAKDFNNKIEYHRHFDTEDEAIVNAIEYKYGFLDAKGNSTLGEILYSV